MNPIKQSSLKIALIVVATSFLIYTIYQAATTTIFIAHFPLVIIQLPKVITSSQPTLQLGLFLFQELAGSAGSYLRLTASILSVNGAILYFRNNPKYMGRFRGVIFFESLYFLLLLPSATNHLVGSVISTSEFLNFYTGVSCLLQALLIFPTLFMLSRKLKAPQNQASILKWVGIAAPLYVFGFWVRHFMLWMYALSSSEPLQAGLIETVGFADSVLTLLVAAIVTIVTCVKFTQKRKLNLHFVGAAIILVGAYFIIYDLVSIWSLTYRAFIPLTDFWMITLPILGTAILHKSYKATSSA